MTTAIKQERNISLDAIKILSCIMVVLLHSLRAFDKTVEMHTYLYYFCRCTMPLFFMAAGAVQLVKDKIEYKYCFKKIKNIILLMLAYYGCDMLIRLSIYHDFTLNGLLTYAKAAYRDFGVFWFLQTMIILYLILPIIHKVYKKHPFIILSVLGVGSLVLNTYNLYNIYFNGADYFVEKNVWVQFRCWIWIFYYILGGVLFMNYKKINISMPILWGLVIITTIIAITYMYKVLYIRTALIDGQWSYTSLSVMIWSSVLMITLMKIDYSSIKGIISQAAPTIIPIYALHYIILHLFIVPIYKFSGFVGQILGFLVVFSITATIAFIITKIPFLKILYKI